MANACAWPVAVELAEIECGWVGGMRVFVCMCANIFEKQLS